MTDGALDAVSKVLQMFVRTQKAIPIRSASELRLRELRPANLLGVERLA